MQRRNSAILCFDVGGRGVKGMLFSDSGRPLSDRIRIPTPHPATPRAILEVMHRVTSTPRFRDKFDRISVGFPGIVKDGVTLSAPNLSPKWRDL